MCKRNVLSDIPVPPKLVTGNSKDINDSKKQRSIICYPQCLKTNNFIIVQFYEIIILDEKELMQINKWPRNQNNTVSRENEKSCRKLNKKVTKGQKNAISRGKKISEIEGKMECKKSIEKGSSSETSDWCELISKLISNV